MTHIKIILLFTFSLFAVSAANSQVQGGKDQSFKVAAPLKHSATFAEVLLRRTELESTLEEMLVSYTEEYPKVKETRFELLSLRKELAKLNSVKKEESGKLTAALGKLIVRKATIETDYWVLANRFSAEHPRVQRAKKKLEIFQKALLEIL